MSAYTKRPGFQRELANDGAYISGTNFAQRVQVQNNTQLDEVLVAGRTPIIELNSSYGTSALRDVETVTGSGSISSSSSGEIVLSTGATATSSAVLETAEVGRYVPGYSAEIGLGIRIPTSPTGNLYGNWGGKTVEGNDGFYFGIDSTGLYVAYLRGGSETKIRQDSWNIDALDGTGPSEFNLDISNGAIFQIDYTWYGYGQIIFGIIGIAPEDGNTVAEGYRYSQGFIPCHSLKVNGTTSVESPNLDVFAEANNGGDATDFDVYVGGRQYSIVGNYVPKYRLMGEIRDTVAVGTTTLPLISFRPKSAFSDRSVKIEAFDIINNGTDDIYVQVYLEPTLTGASWQTPTDATAAETSVESDISATAMSGGVLLSSGTLVPSGTNKTGSSIARELDFDVPDGQVVTLAATSFAGTNDVRSGFKIREEW